MNECLPCYTVCPLWYKVLGGVVLVSSMSHFDNDGGSPERHFVDI